MKSFLIRTTAAVFTATCLLSAPVAFAQEKSEEETLEDLKTLTLACAVIYQVQLDANAVTDRTLYSTRQKTMQDVHVALTEKPAEEIAAQVTNVKGGFDDIRRTDPEKFKGYFELCEALSE